MVKIGEGMGPEFHIIVVYKSVIKNWYDENKSAI